MTQKREYFVSEPPSTPNASVIWLHGLGADGNDFAGIVDQLGFPNDHGVRFIFPSAPFMKVTVNQGMMMRAWYDIYELNMLRKEDEHGVKRSQAEIEEYIAHEVAAGIPADRIILAGFSQGGAMSLYTAIHHKEQLCAAIVLSAYLPLAPQTSAASFGNRELPIFMAHGMFDPVVPYILGQEAYELLKEHNYPVEWYSYPMQHTVCIEEINAIGTFMQRCLGYA